MKLYLRERGTPVAVALSDWRNNRLEETVGALDRAGILRVDRTSAAIILTPKNFVGEMHGPNISLSILPKDNALYEAMLALAIQFEGRNAQHHAEVTDAGKGEDLAALFVDALGDALEDGLPWAYAKAEVQTSQPRGKLGFGKTVAQFVSKGVFHRVVATQHDRKQVAAFVNVVWAAYRCLPTVPGSSPKLTARAARLIEALDPQDAFDLSDILGAASACLTNGELQSVPSQKLVRVALTILEYESDAGYASIFVPSGIARFINLERVWERAVAELVRTALGQSGLEVALHGLASQELKLFGCAGPKINPDVTALAPTGEVQVLADAKYKILSEGEFGGQAPDLYQLSCYVNRTQANKGFLVYLGTRDSIETLGRTESGGDIVVAALSSEALASNKQDALALLLGSNPGG